MTDQRTVGCEGRDSYVDGELTALESAAFDRHAAGCPACQKEIELVLRLRAELRSGLTRYAADDAVRERLLASLPGRPSQPTQRRRPGRREWLSMAAAASIAAILASGTTLYALRTPPQEAWAEAVLASHLRATLSGHLFDIASSDRHRVKPWFSGRTAVAPIVVDLSAVGYPLLGGRLDIPQREPLPVLVYKAGPHLVSLFVRPGSGATQPALGRKDGFAMLMWREHGFDFSAVSDADATELLAFQRAFSAGLAQSP